MNANEKTNVPMWPSALALVASILGFSFALSSTLDYASHLDRQVHDIHCSFIPGLGADASQDSACRAAMYSPYSALFKEKYWGGVPISLFAVGAFGFFAAFALYLLLARDRAPRRAQQFLFLAGITPLAVSVVMFVISLTKLGVFCKTCVGMYASSVLLAVAATAAVLYDRARAAAALEEFRRPGPARTVYAPPTKAALELEKADKPDKPSDAQTLKSEGVDRSEADKADDAKAADADKKADEKAPGKVAPTAIDDVPAIETPDAEPAFKPPRTGGFLLIPAWLLALAIFAVVPAALYISAMPSYATYVTGCGKLEKPADPTNVLLHVQPAGAKQQATMLVDPLCPTCKAFHQRLVTEGIFDKLDTTLVLFPLDNECNWMLDRALHPGACTVARAVICGEKENKALAVLEWSYEHQEDLLGIAKGNGGIPAVRRWVGEKWPTLAACIDAKETKQRLDKTMRWIVQNQLQVSTPQLFLDGTRLCDEDSDIGLSYTLSKLAPNLVRSR